MDYSHSILKIPSGIPGSDEVAMGGLPVGRLTLILGTAGSGKTIFAMQFIYNGITDFNENGVFVTFEESVDDLVKNASSFGWDLKRLIEMNRLIIMDASHQSEEIEAGSYDLSGFIVRLENAIKKINAKRVAIDSVSAIFSKYPNVGLVRREIFRISEALRKLGVTAIATGERLSELGELSRFGVEEFVADNIIVLYNEVDELGNRQRNLEILKFRGAKHVIGKTAFIINEHGIEVFPKVKLELGGESFLEKVSTGIEGLDKMLDGGLYRNSTTLVSGPPGTGKTLLSLHFAWGLAQKGEKSVILEFEESKEQLLRNAETIGKDIRKYVEEGLIKVICLYPENIRMEQYLKLVREIIEEEKPCGFILDSVSALERIYTEREFREFALSLNTILKMSGVTALFTHTSGEILGISSITQYHFSTVVDNVIILKYSEIGGKIGRVLTILKARGSNHSKDLVEYEIGSRGIEILKPLIGFEGVLFGSARFSKEYLETDERLKKLEKFFKDEGHEG